MIKKYMLPYLDGSMDYDASNLLLASLHDEIMADFVLLLIYIVALRSNFDGMINDDIKMSCVFLNHSN